MRKFLIYDLGFGILGYIDFLVWCAIIVEEVPMEALFRYLFFNSLPMKKKYIVAFVVVIVVIALFYGVLFAGEGADGGKLIMTQA